MSHELFLKSWYHFTYSMSSFVTMGPNKANILFYYIYFTYITYLLYLLCLKCFISQSEKNLRLREVKKLSKFIQLVCGGDRGSQEELRVLWLWVGHSFCGTRPPLLKGAPFLPRTVKSAVGHHHLHQSAPLSLKVIMKSKPWNPQLEEQQKFCLK